MSALPLAFVRPGERVPWVLLPMAAREPPARWIVALARGAYLTGWWFPARPRRERVGWRVPIMASRTQWGVVLPEAVAVVGRGPRVMGWPLERLAIAELVASVIPGARVLVRHHHQGIDAGGYDAGITRWRTAGAERLRRGTGRPR